MKIRGHKYNKYLLILLLLLIGSVDYFRLEKINNIWDFSMWNYHISVLIIANLIAIILLFKKSGIPLVSFTSAFLIIAAAFNCGQCLVNYLGLEILRHGNVYVLFGFETYRKVIIYSFWAIYFTSLGIICSQLLASSNIKIKLKTTVHLIPKIDNCLLERQKILTIVLFFISLPAQLYLTYRQLTNTISYGYNVAATMTINPLISYLSKLLISAVVLALFQLNKKKGFVLYLGFIAMNIITMLGGVRSYAFLSIVVVTYVYFIVILEQKINIKDIIFWGILGILAVHLLVAIRDVRAYGFSFELLKESFLTGKDGALGSYFSETTVTHGVLGYVINNENNINQPIMGQFISGVLGIIPGISIISPIDLKQFDMQKVLDIPEMGGSFIADFYFDHVLILFSFLWGVCINRIFSYFEREKNILKCAFWSPIITQVLFSVRTTTAQLPRMIIWMGIVYYSVVFIFKSNRRSDVSKKLNTENG